MRALIVTNLYPTESTPHSGTFIKRQVTSLREAGVEVEVLHFARQIQGTGVYRSVPAEVERRIGVIKPDVVHVMYGGVLAAQVARSAGEVPLVVSFAGSDILGADFSSLCWGRKDTGRRRLATIYAGVLASRYAARLAAVNIVKSSIMKEALPRTAKRKVRVIPNGVDLTTFVPMDRVESARAVGLDPDTFNVLFASGFHRSEKRPALAQAAVNELKSMGIRAEIHPLDGIPPEAVPVWLNAADVILMTSRYEGSPNVVKEALACNRPVISVPVGDVEERLRGVTECYVVEPSSRSIAERLYELAGRRLPSSGRTAVQHLSLEAVAAQVVNIYNAVSHSGAGEVRTA